VSAIVIGSVGDSIEALAFAIGERQCDAPIRAAMASAFFIAWTLATPRPAIS
jgi:hypothetical protein